MAGTRRKARISTISTIADMMREAYNGQRDHWYALRGREVEPIAGDPETWQKMAAFMLDHKIGNYLAFIHMQFRALGNGGSCPPPKHCYGPAALKRWTQDPNRAKANLEDAELELRLQKGILQAAWRRALVISKDTGWTMEQRDTYVLVNTENELTPLFRCCIATQLSRADIVDDFFDLAVIEYLLNQDGLDEAWGDMIPAKVREAAQQRTLSGFFNEE